MANDFSSTDGSNSGILKSYYDASPMEEALKRKRQKLSETKLGDKAEDKPSED